MNSVIQIIEDHDEDFLDDFSANVHLDLESIEKYLMGATLDSEGQLDFQELFAHVEKIKMSCRSTFIDPLVGYINVVEEVLTTVYRQHYLRFPILTELMLLMFDEVRAATEEIHVRKSLDTQLLDEFRDAIKTLQDAHFDDLQRLSENVLQRFAYRVHPDTVFSATEIHSAPPVISEIDLNAELEIFRDHADANDNRSEFTIGRSKQILNTALAIHWELPTNLQVNTSQLIAAVYMHDITMAYIPDKVLFKQEKFTADEVMLLEQHPIQSSQLLKITAHWQAAAEMVYQHHERFDGSGYPNGIKHNEISMGAKIIGVADTYYSLTHKRPDRPFQKSALRALLEINKHTGTLFDPYVVEALNLALKK